MKYLQVMISSEFRTQALRLLDALTFIPFTEIPKRTVSSWAPERSTRSPMRVHLAAANSPPSAQERFTSAPIARPPTLVDC
jgi:hypothetical protein